MTFSQLSSLVIGRAFPGRMARNMIPLRQRHVVSGLIDLQTYIPGLQDRNTSVYLGENFYQCGAMVVDRPPGHITRVEAFRGDVPDAGDTVSECQCVVPYDLSGVEFIRSRCQEYVDEGGVLLDSDGNYILMLPQDRGWFAVEPETDKLWAYPAAVSPWALRVQYRAIVTDYQDDDTVIDLEPTQVDLLIRWVEWKGAVDDRVFNDAAALKSLYREERADEIYRLNQQIIPEKVRRSPRAPSPFLGLCSPNCSSPYAY